MIPLKPARVSRRLEGNQWRYFLPTNQIIGVPCISARLPQLPGRWWVFGARTTCGQASLQLAISCKTYRTKRMGSRQPGL